MRWLLISIKNDIYLIEFETHTHTHTHTLCCSSQNEAFCGQPKLRGGGGHRKAQRHAPQRPSFAATGKGWVMDHIDGGGGGGVGLGIPVVCKRCKLDRQIACELGKRIGSS